MPQTRTRSFHAMASYYGLLSLSLRNPLHAALRDGVHGGALGLDNSPAGHCLFLAELLKDAVHPSFKGTVRGPEESGCTGAGGRWGGKGEWASTNSTGHLLCCAGWEGTLGI